jgi:hypothetical protein
VIQSFEDDETEVGFAAVDSREQKPTEADVDQAATGRPLPPVTLTWAQDVKSETPLLCVSGESPKIKIIDAQKGKLVRVGHPFPQPARHRV